MIEAIAEGIPTVSVIIPTCGRLDFLKEALLSVLNQTFKDFEILLVNDGGIDICPVLNSLPSRNKIVYLEHDQNRGVAAARNTAIKAARGKYLAYLDDDDVYYPDHLETLISYLQGGPHKVAYTDAHQEFFEWITDRYVSKGKREAFGIDFDRQKLLVHNYIPTLNIAHERKILDHVGLFDESLETHEDWDLWIRLSRKYDFHHIRKITTAFRTFSGPWKSASANRTSILKTLRIIYKRYADLLDNPSLIEERKRFQRDLSLEVQLNNMPLILDEYVRLHRYAHAAPLVAGKKVLDLGCKDGKGSFILAQQADSVTGVDPRPDNIKRATSRYGGGKLSFLTGHLEHVPIADNSCFDVVTCFDGLYSVSALKDVLREVKRLLKPDGFFLASVPNLALSDKEPALLKKAFSWGLHLNDFRSLLSSQFKNVQILGQGVFISSKMFSLLTPSNIQDHLPLTKDDSGFILSDSAKEQAHAFFAIASNHQIKAPPVNSLLTDTTNTLMHHQESLEQSIAQLQSELSQKDNEIAKLQGLIDQKETEHKAAIAQLQSELSQKNSELDQANQIVQQQEAHIGSLTQHLDSIHKSRSWKLVQAYAKLKNTFYLKPKFAYNIFIQHVRMEGSPKTIQRTWQYLKERGQRVKEIPGVVHLPGREVYEVWMSRHRPALPELLQQRQETMHWEDRPLISLIVPVYNTKETWLRELLSSICAQTYDHWEAILVDDNSSSLRTIAILEEQARREKRFRLIERSQNGGVAAACQDGLEAARGVFVAVVDHDDIMEPDALYHIASRLRLEPDADVIYSDEALIDENGKVINVVFRPEYSYNRLLSHPYIVHLTAFRRSLALSVGGFDPSFQVSQDYDLLLRMAAVTDRFSHVPKVLYFWRQHHDSTGHVKINEVMGNSIRALQRHLEIKKIKGAVVQPGLSFNFFRVRYPIKEAFISIIIPTRDRVDLLRRCIESLKQKTELASGTRYELVIADNDSKNDETLAYLRILQKEGHQVVRCPGSFNFSRLNNTAVRKSNGDILLFLNNDIEVVEGEWLMALLEHARRPEVGAVGAKLIYPNGLIQHAGVIIGINQQSAGHSHQFFLEREHGHLSGGHLGELLCIRECMAVTAACLMVRREVFEKVNGFDEEFAVGFGDTDLCLRIRKQGFVNLWTPYARLIHHESASRGKRGDELHLHPEDLKRLKARWKDVILRGDPYYNPNLSPESNNFSPAI